VLVVAGLIVYPLNFNTGKLLPQRLQRCTELSAIFIFQRWQIWEESHFSRIVEAIYTKSLQTDGRTDKRRTPRSWIVEKKYRLWTFTSSVQMTPDYGKLCVVKCECIMTIINCGSNELMLWIANTGRTFCYLVSPVLIDIRTDADTVGAFAAYSCCSAANDDKNNASGLNRCDGPRTFSPTRRGVTKW